MNRSASRAPCGITVNLSADWLSRVYGGSDRDGFLRWLARMIQDPDALVIARSPDVLGVARVIESDYELGRVVKGYILSADWPTVLTAGITWARARGAQRFLYPLMEDNPKAAKIERVLCGRYGFRRFQTIYQKELLP